jgi:hypothetical protein
MIRTVGMTTMTETLGGSSEDDSGAGGRERQPEEQLACAAGPDPGCLGLGGCGDLDPLPYPPEG